MGGSYRCHRSLPLGLCTCQFPSPNPSLFTLSRHIFTPALGLCFQPTFSAGPPGLPSCTPCPPPQWFSPTPQVHPVQDQPHRVLLYLHHHSAPPGQGPEALMTTYDSCQGDVDLAVRSISGSWQWPGRTWPSPQWHPLPILTLGLAWPHLIQEANGKLDPAESPPQGVA